MNEVDDNSPVSPYKVAGLTKREYAAITIAAGLAAYNGASVSGIPVIAVLTADALLKELHNTHKRQEER